MVSLLRRNPFSYIPMGSITACLRYTFAIIFLIINFTAAAQTDSIPVFKNAIAANRSKTYNNIIKNIITKNLSLPLTDSTEENWQDAFYAMEVLQYKQPWVLEKVKQAFDSANKRSPGFQRSLIELCYTNYKTQFEASITKLLESTENRKVFSMCAEYKLNNDISLSMQNYLTDLINTRMHRTGLLLDDLILDGTLWSMAERERTDFEHSKNKLPFLINNSFRTGNTIIYSIQRKNRNYSGIAIIRDSAGNFITDAEGNIFSVPQLARSITNLPGYLTNGNTPQGIFRMNGFAVSRSAAIGPTENIQLLMPYETSPQYFLKDSSITDTVWTKELYQRLLPKELINYYSLYGTYYASACGRTEIIAHGTTVDPDYYRGQTYYPHTPTQGCLCTKEIWNATDGKRTESNQQKLVDAVKKAGGANGYLVVIEIDDKQQPVTLQDVLPFLPKQK